MALLFAFFLISVLLPLRRVSLFDGVIAGIHLPPEDLSSGPV